MSVFGVKFKPLLTMLLVMGAVIALVLMPALPSYAYHGGQLLLDKTANLDPATVEEPLDFTITLTSKATATEFSGLRIIDKLPEGTTYLSSEGQRTNAYGETEP